MSEITFLELGIAAFIELFSISMLIITAIRDPPTQRASSIVRAIYLIPGMIAAGIMMGVDPVIHGIQTVTKTDVMNSTTMTLITNSTQVSNPILTILDMPTWWSLHLMIFLVLLSYIFIQLLTLFTKSE